MPTDLEKFTKAHGRDDLIKQVRKKIDALGIDYLYLQFISVTGRIMGKGIPADHWENVANGGFQLVYGATVNLFLNRRGEYSATVPRHPSSSAYPSPRPSCSSPGTSASRACSARCSAIARSATIPAAISRPTAAATCAASTTSSRTSTGCACATAPSRR